MLFFAERLPSRCSMRRYVVYKLTFFRKGRKCVYIGVTEVLPGMTPTAAVLRRRHWHVHPPPGCIKAQWLTEPYDLGSLSVQTLTGVLAAGEAWDVELWETAEAMLQEGGFESTRGGWGWLLPIFGSCRCIVARQGLRFGPGPGRSP